MKLATRIKTALALAGAAALGVPFDTFAQNEIFVPALVYRTGASVLREKTPRSNRTW